MSYAAALRRTDNQVAEFQAILAQIPDKAFDKEAEVIAARKRLADAERAYHDACERGQRADIYTANATLTDLRAEIERKRQQIDDLALEALLVGDTSGERVADVCAEIQRMEWRAEALQRGIQRFYARADELNAAVRTTQTALQAARRHLADLLTELRYAKARAELFGDQADSHADEDGFRAPRVKTTHW